MFLKIRMLYAKFMSFLSKKEYIVVDEEGNIVSIYKNGTPLKNLVKLLNGKLKL